MICAAISTIPTLFVITIFNKTKRRIPVVNDANPSLDESEKLDSEIYANDDVEKSKSIKSRLLKTVSSFFTCRPAHYTEIPEEEYTYRTGRENSKFQLPYWFVYIGWFLAIGE